MRCASAPRTACAATACSGVSSSAGKNISKACSLPSTLFEEFGFHYFGPIDGHDLPQLLHALKTLKNLKGPQLLHVITTKGKGYAPAEREQIEYHAVGPFDPVKGLVKKAPGKQSYTEVFGDWLCDMAKGDERLLAITPAMREGSGLVRYSKEFPQRYFDVGIAEQHAVTLAAGMACEGAKPVVAIYSTFLQRAYDQAIHDVAVQNLDVTFAIDRAGVVGPDGATHAGSFDLSYLRCIPNMIVAAPSDENECRQLLTAGFLYNGPAAIQIPTRRRSWRKDRGRTQAAADRQGRHALARREPRDPRVRQPADCRTRSRQGTWRNCGQYAFREAAR